MVKTQIKDFKNKNIGHEARVVQFHHQMPTTNAYRSIPGIPD